VPRESETWSAIDGLGPADREAIIEAALGLTADEAENAFSKCLVKARRFDIDVILAEKEQIIRKSRVLEFHRAAEQFSDIGGLDQLKEWLRKRQAAFSRQAREFGLPESKGILLIGVPGCGKSLTAKAVSSLWKLPLLRLDMGRVFEGLVGSSEENARQAIRMAEAIAPSILWIDELEKGFAGTQSSNFSDAGTTARVFGTFVTWLQEKTSPVFVISTANNISALPPELLRKGRFDEIFFVDLPKKKEREEIFGIHLRKRRRDPASFDLDKLAAASEGFSGSEIEQAIISALFDAFDEQRDLTTDGVLVSLRETITLSQTMEEEIHTLRQWALARARMASTPIATERESGVRRLEV
jgi:SpoVK/Ycf46/Vps4 family AAA+-type ATPase